jgi:hypothetical protein
VDYPLLTALAGTWRGHGRGSYPTISDFSYTEEFVIEPIPGRPVAHWRSRSADERTGDPRHAESGFLRVTPTGAELVVAHNFGIVEISTGSAVEPVGDSAWTLISTALWGTQTAKPVDRVSRSYRIGGDRLDYEMSMAAVGVTLTHHLAASLHR